MKSPGPQGPGLSFFWLASGTRTLFDVPRVVIHLDPGVGRVASDSGEVGQPGLFVVIRNGQKDFHSTVGRLHRKAQETFLRSDRSIATGVERARVDGIGEQGIVCERPTADILVPEPKTKSPAECGAFCFDVEFQFSLDGLLHNECVQPLHVPLLSHLYPV